MNENYDSAEGLPLKELLVTLSRTEFQTCSFSKHLIVNFCAKNNRQEQQSDTRGRLWNGVSDEGWGI